MLDFGSNPIERQLVLSAQFLHQELPVRLAHRVAELENLPYGLSVKPHVVKVWQLCPFVMCEAHCTDVFMSTVHELSFLIIIYRCRFGTGMLSHSETFETSPPLKIMTMK